MSSITNTHSLPCDLSVQFQEGLTTARIRNSVREMQNPQVVLWYFGANGVKENGVTFYRDNLMEMIHYDNNPTMWLYDVTAWAALKNTKVPLSKSNGIVDQVEQYHSAVKCIRSSDIFTDMKSLEGELLDYFKNKVVTREHLKDASTIFQDNNIRIMDIFQDNYPVLEPIAHLDTAKTYSVLQYLEFFFLIERILLDKLESSDTIDITFALPNDESKYYQKNPVEEDLKRYLQERIGEKIAGKVVNIHVLCFNYSTEPLHRPYNAPGKVLKKSKINPDLVLPK